jgi:hypothetical protein
MPNENDAIRSDNRRAAAESEARRIAEAARKIQDDARVAATQRQEAALLLRQEIDARRKAARALRKSTAARYLAEWHALRHGLSIKPMITALVAGLLIGLAVRGAGNKDAAPLTTLVSSSPLPLVLPDRLPTLRLRLDRELAQSPRDRR